MPRAVPARGKRSGCTWAPSPAPARGQEAGVCRWAERGRDHAEPTASGLEKLVEDSFVLSDDVRSLIKWHLFKQVCEEGG